MRHFGKYLASFGAAASMLITGAAAGNLGGGIVNADALNFRAEASTDSTILACVDYGTEVVVVEQTDEEWYKVILDGVQGYMFATYVDPETTLDFDVGDGSLTGSSVRLRDAASWDSDTITYLNLGEKVVVKGVSGEWYKVEYNGNVGYVHSDYISVKNNNNATVDTTVAYTAGQALADYAMDFLGTTYVYGGAAPGGFDCSGFMYYIFNQNGYAITRTASSQWYDGTYVEKADLQVGDLVFFSSDYSSEIEHVGMYIGNGQFIHASSGGGCVKLNNLSDYYYENNYYGAMRVI